jgi:hypothetical protein
MSKVKGYNSAWRRGFDAGIRDDFLPGTKILEFVSFCLPEPCTDAQLVQKIADELHLQIESLPEELDSRTMPRGRGVFGSATYYLDCIVANYPNMAWKVDDGILRFGVEVPEVQPLRPFDQVAGRLMSEAPRGSNRRIPDMEYRRIVGEIDRHGLGLLPSRT